MTFFESLTELAIPIDKSQTQKKMLPVFDTVAKEMGNTRNACTNYYINSLLMNKYEQDNVCQEFRIVDTTETENSMLGPSVKVVLNLLQTYAPNWAKTA